MQYLTFTFRTIRAAVNAVAKETRRELVDRRIVFGPGFEKQRAGVLEHAAK